jgi:hypothetical protein
VLYTCVLRKFFLEIFFCSFYSLFQIFCVKRPDGYPERPNGYSGCPDDTVSSSARLWFLSGRPCFRNRLRGTTSRRYLCSVRTVNPIGLNHFLPAPQLTFWPPLCCFVVLCVFLVHFMHSSHVHVSSLDFISIPGIFLLFYYLVLSFLA